MAYLNTAQVAVRFGLMKVERQPDGSYLEVPDRLAALKRMRQMPGAKRLGKSVLVPEEAMTAALKDVRGAYPTTRRRTA